MAGSCYSFCVDIVRSLFWKLVVYSCVVSPHSLSLFLSNVWFICRTRLPCTRVCDVKQKETGSDHHPGAGCTNNSVSYHGNQTGEETWLTVSSRCEYLFSFSFFLRLEIAAGTTQLLVKNKFTQTQRRTDCVLWHIYKYACPVLCVYVYVCVGARARVCVYLG